MKRLAVSGASKGRRRTTRRLISMIRSIYASAKIRRYNRMVFEVTAQKTVVTRKSQQNVNFPKN
jgi:hypothetical protein